MPKKSSKSKTKRKTLHQKYKIIKKVKEHKKKKAKELKKLGGRVKAPKDPGIPAAWPFKEQLLKEIEIAKQKEEALKQQRKEAQKERRALKRQHEDEDDEDQGTIETVARKAALRGAEFAEEEHERSTRGNVDDLDNDRSRRAFFKEFCKVVDAADVIIQVLDARDPLSCRSPEVERFIRKRNPEKKIVLLLNKIDLVPKEVVEKWLSYFRGELPTVAFKCQTQKSTPGGGDAARGGGKKPAKGAKGGKGKDSIDATGLGTKDSLGAEMLLGILKNYARSRNMKTAITVGVVGLPNVGKSSLINSLKRTRAVSVGATPGLTRSMQEIVLDKHVKLLDSPGIVFAAANDPNDAAAALRNAIRIEKLEDPVAPVGEILKRCKAPTLMQIYGIPRFASSDEFLRSVASKRGKLKKGGVIDIQAAARLVLGDWNGGRIPFYTLPPSRGNEEHSKAEVVNAFGSEFNVDAMNAALIEGAGDDGDTDMFAEVPTAGPLVSNLDAMEAEAEAGAAGGGEEEEEDDDEAEEMDEEDAAPPPKKKQKDNRSQNEKLYSEEGMFNPKAARAAKKAAKKGKKGAAGGDGEDGNGSDFDWDSVMPAPTRGAAAGKKGAAAKKPAAGSRRQAMPEDDDGDDDDDDDGMEEDD